MNIENRQLPDHLKRWVFGKSVEVGPAPTDWAESMTEKFGGEWVKPPSDLTKTLFEELKPSMSRQDWAYVKTIIVETAMLDKPDARCARLNDLGLIGIDFRLFLLIHNVAVLLFATENFEIPGLIDANTSGMNFEKIKDAVREEIELAVDGQISCNDESILPSKNYLNICMWLVFMAEQFVVGHEIGHLVMNEFEIPLTNDSSQAHSFIYGFATGKEEENATQERSSLDNWVSELLADRYAAGLLSRSLGLPDEKMANYVCAVVFCFLFHLLDTYARAVIVKQGGSSVLHHHPPPYWRLKFCGVPYHLYEPHVKYFGPQPFKMIAKLFDFIGWGLEISYLLKFRGDSSISPYHDWASRSDTEFIVELNKLILQVESAYHDDAIKNHAYK